jgi:hypothetical protein
MLDSLVLRFTLADLLIKYLTRWRRRWDSPSLALVRELG